MIFELLVLILLLLPSMNWFMLADYKENLNRKLSYIPVSPILFGAGQFSSSYFTRNPH